MKMGAVEMVVWVVDDGTGDGDSGEKLRKVQH